MKTLPLAIGQTHGLQSVLERAFRHIAKRHHADFEIKQGCKLFARWAQNHRHRLNVVSQEYGIVSDADSRRLAGALFHGTWGGGFGLLRDLQDTLTLVLCARNSWTVLSQAGKELRNTKLVETATDVGTELDKINDWLCAHIKIAAPQALTVPMDVSRELKTSIPARVTSALLPRVPHRGGATAITFALGLLAGHLITVHRGHRS